MSRRLRVSICFRSCECIIGAPNREPLTPGNDWTGKRLREKFRNFKEASRRDDNNYAEDQRKHDNTRKQCLEQNAKFFEKEISWQWEFTECQFLGQCVTQTGCCSLTLLPAPLTADALSR
ncbi:hypothetical protein RRG08_010552 [Elysia crispata]|uniref:Uncharacterized protein n=1 Tax=Elysia crispata TaxID=231223 RepID=A0AAE1E7C4_9GAST|nr:hypothetical protein RRG08_010552 [Elysia crispata]